MLMKKLVNRATVAALAALIVASGCGGGRLSSDQARKQIIDISSSGVVPDAIQIRRVVTQGDREAIAEATATLAFQFKRENRNAPWKIGAVRLGDNDWLDMNELLAAINDARRRSTLESIGRLNAAVEAYRQANGNLPSAPDIVKLTDQLFPGYLDKLVRDDAWKRPFRYEASGATFRIISNGPNGIAGDSDDLSL
jgi:hypothetical protein